MKPAAPHPPLGARRRALGGAFLGAALLALAPATPLAQHPGGHVIANGGGTTSGGGFVLNGTIGQPVVGASGGAANMLCHGFWCFGGARVLDAGPAPGAPLPVALRVGPAFPSPSRDVVSFALELPRAARVRLAVHDVAGRAVGEAVTRAFDAGWQRLEWRAPRGRSGVYFARLTVDGQDAGERRIVLAR